MKGAAGRRAGAAKKKRFNGPIATFHQLLLRLFFLPATTEGFAGAIESHRWLHTLGQQLFFSFFITSISRDHLMDKSTLDAKRSSSLPFKRVWSEHTAAAAAATLAALLRGALSRLTQFMIGSASIKRDSSLAAQMSLALIALLLLL